MLPGQPEAQNAAHTAKAGGLLFSTAEVEALNEIADEVGSARFDVAGLKTYDVP
jgi:L-2-hydroxycarboxylate dehydrogenase (NAD+)